MVLDEKDIEIVDAPKQYNKIQDGIIIRTENIQESKKLKEKLIEYKKQADKLEKFSIEAGETPFVVIDALDRKIDGLKKEYVSLSEFKKYVDFTFEQDQKIKQLEAKLKLIQHILSAHDVNEETLKNLGLEK